MRIEKMVIAILMPSFYLAGAFANSKTVDKVFATFKKYRKQVTNLSMDCLSFIELQAGLKPVLIRTIADTNCTLDPCVSIYSS